MSVSVFRRRVRVLHLIAAGILGAYLYSPWSSNPIFSAVTLYVAFPFLGLSCLALWRPARIVKLFS